VRQFIEGLSVGPIKMKLKDFDVDESHNAAAPAAPAGAKGKR
jgi:hypothetical protein